VTKKYYLDACIWRDYFEGRVDRFRPLGEWAFRLIKKIIAEEGLFLITDALIEELENFYSFTELERLFKIVPVDLMVLLGSNKYQVEEALQTSKQMHIPRKDALHAILARDNDAVLITRDKHFDNLPVQFEVKKPEDLI